MSDPSVIIGPPSNIWQSTDRHTFQCRRRRRDQPKTKHRTKKRRRHRSYYSSSSLRSSSLASQRRSKRSRRFKHSHNRRKSRLTSSSSSSSSSHDYGRYIKKKLDNLLRLRKFRQVFMRMWCNNLQGTHDPFRSRQPGPLIGILMKNSDYFHRSYVLNRWRKILLQNHTVWNRAHNEGSSVSIISCPTVKISGSYH